MADEERIDIFKEIEDDAMFDKGLEDGKRGIACAMQYDEAYTRGYRSGYREFNEPEPAVDPQPNRDTEETVRILAGLNDALHSTPTNLTSLGLLLSEERAEEMDYESGRQDRADDACPRFPDNLIYMRGYNSIILQD